jgi:diamine N-acetyltransferase
MLTTTFVIRPLAQSDLPLVIQLSYRIWPAAYDGILTPAQLDNLLARIYVPENLIAEMAAGHCFWAAFDGDTALGYVSGYRDGKTIWIKKLYVLPQAQKRGLGRALIDTVTAAFGPAEELRLYVNDRNTAAQAAYARLGFTQAAAVPVRMGDYDFTDFIYVKPLCR